MSKKYYITFLFLLISIGIFSQGRVDGFFKGQGNLDLVIGGGYEANANYFAGTDKIDLKRNITIGNAFLAYGITKKLDVNASIPFLDVNGVESGIQDFAIFLKHKIVEKDGWTIGLAAGYSSNITDYEVGGGSALGQQAKIIDGRLVVHHMSSNGIFVTLQGGYSYKLDPVPASVPFTFKTGLAKGKYYFDLWYDFQHGIGGFDYRGTPAPPSFRELGVSYHKVGGTFYKPLGKRIGFYVGAYYTLSGRNTAQGPGFNLGIVLKHFKKNTDE